LKPGGILAVLASLGLAGLLLLRLDEVEFLGTAETATEERCSFWVENVVSGYAFLPQTPRTFPSDRCAFSIVGTKGDSDVVAALRLPEALHGRVSKGTRVEVVHAFLDLAVLGALAGRTTIRTGSADWSDGPWRLWGAIVGIAALPLLGWALVSAPVLLLRKRPRVNEVMRSLR
jgi:hypothetical protein